MFINTAIAMTRSATQKADTRYSSFHARRLTHNYDRGTISPLFPRRLPPVFAAALTLARPFGSHSAYGTSPSVRLPMECGVAAG